MANRIKIDPEIEALMGPRLVGPDADFGFSCSTVARGSEIEITYDKAGLSFVIWIRPRTDRSGSDASDFYLQTRMFDIGYRGDPPDSSAFDLMDAVAARVRENESVWDGRLHGARAKGADSDPLVSGGRLEIRVTRKCNEKCPFCNTDQSAVNVITEPDEIDRTLKRAAELGAWKVVFTGGEPTLADGLPSWVAMAKGLGLRVWLQTNGVIPGERGYWDRFQDAEGRPVLPDAVLVSFHTRFADRVGRITGVAGTLENKIRSVRSALELGLEVGISYVVTTMNLDETDAFPAFVADTFGAGVELCFSLMAPAGKALDNLDLIPAVSDVAPHPHIARALDESRRMGITALVLEVCGFPMCVLPDHIKQFDAWRPGRDAVKMPPDRVKWDFCERCALDSQCIGMWREYVRIHGSEGFGPVPSDRIDS